MEIKRPEIHGYVRNVEDDNGLAALATLQISTMILWMTTIILLIHKLK